MRKLIVLGLMLVMAPLRAEEAKPVETKAVSITQILSSTVTASGQPITLPQKDAQVTVLLYDIAPGASLPIHKHPFPRYAYVLAGSLRVTNTETGKANDYKAGDFIVEMVGQWHQGSNIGTEPIKLLVMDFVEKGQANTIVKKD